jgi:hypothetical protein
MKPWNLTLFVALLLAVVGTSFAQQYNDPGTFATVAQMKYRGSYITSTNTVAPVTATTPLYSDALRVDGANRLVFDVKQTNAGASSGTHTAKVQVSPDGVYWGVPAAVVAEAGPTATQVLNETLTFTGAQSYRLTVVGVAPSNYVRLQFNAGTPASGTITFTEAYCTYSYDGPPGDRRQVKVQKFKKNGVEITAAAATDLAVAGGASGYTDGIKIEDCTTLAFALNMVSSTAGATTHAVKVQVSPDNTNWFDPVPEGSDQYIYKDLDAGWGATANTCRSWVVSGFLPAKYVRLYWTSEAAKDVTLGPIYCITY